MVVSQAILDALKQIGLNLYERKLWVALLSRGTSTAGELSSLAKVPHSRTYDVLESLAEKGFVMIQNAKPLKYVAITPNEALERVKKKIKEDTEISIERINQFQKSPYLKELEKIYKKGVELIEPGELTASLKGRNALYQQLETCFKNAKNSISILTTTTGLNDLHILHSDVLKKAAERGVKIRIAAQYGKEHLPIIEKLKEFAEIKKITKPSITGRFCVVDGSHVVMSLTDEDVHPTQDLAFWSQSKHIAADVLQPIFDFIWQSLD
ncbi:MAG: helix-turn-helix domain-containing protein [Candidatus Aenigmatarchaeota archaeon]